MMVSHLENCPLDSLKIILDDKRINSPIWVVFVFKIWKVFQGKIECFLAK